MTSLMDRMKKKSTLDYTSVLTDSEIFGSKDMFSTPVPMVNVGLSGDVNGGMQPGILMLAGPSKHFKTAFALLMVKSYMDKYPDAVILFYDSEFGAPESYFNSFGIDSSRVLHSPITDIEQLKFDILAQLDEIKRNDRVLILIDSIGNLASKKEVEDTREQKSAADMTRAKQLKSLFRIVTPHLTLKNIPMVVVNHTYKEIGLFPKDIVGGGTGGVYSSDNIWIIGRQQEKDGTAVSGYNFIINIEKSRHVKEKSKIGISVSFEGGINKWSGLLDMALLSGHVIKPKNGWYAKVDKSTGEIIGKNYREADTNCAEFWDPLLKDTSFTDFIRNHYKLAEIDMLSADQVAAEIAED